MILSLEKILSWFLSLSFIIMYWAGPNYKLVLKQGYSKLGLANNIYKELWRICENSKTSVDNRQWTVQEKANLFVDILLECRQLPRRRKEGSKIAKLCPCLNPVWYDYRKQEKYPSLERAEFQNNRIYVNFHIQKSLEFFIPPRAK